MAANQRLVCISNGQSNQYNYLTKLLHQLAYSVYQNVPHCLEKLYL